MMKLYFVSTNSRKYKSYAATLTKHDIELIHVDHELQEPQSVDVTEIVRHKLAQAKVLLPNKRVFVDDRGFIIPVLNNFPGPMLKLTLATIGVDGLLALMKDEKDRSAEFITGIGYFDGENDHVVESIEKGFLTAERQGDDLRGWTELLYVYGHNSFNGRSLASLNDNEWNDYLEILRKNDVTGKLAAILK